MKRFSKHLGFARHLGEFQFKSWLDKNASDFLAEVGVRSGQVVLDFGCGSGTYTIPAAKLVGEGGRVYALDMSRRALERVEEKAKQEGLENMVRIEASGDEKLRLEDESVDIMLLIDVLQEIKDKEALFDEVYRILRSGGCVVAYPMHLEAEEVEGLATSRGLKLEDRKFQDSILLFSKTQQS